MDGAAVEVVAHAAVEDLVVTIGETVVEGRFWKRQMFLMVLAKFSGAVVKDLAEFPEIACN